MIRIDDFAGLAGVVMMLGAYAGAQLRVLDPVSAPALIANLIGAGLVMFSLSHQFNLSAFLMEAAWAVIAAFGLLRLMFKRR